MSSVITRREQVAGITLPVPAEKIKNVNAEIRNVQIDVIRDKVVIQGIVHKQLFFVDLEGVVRHFPEDVPFSTFIDVPGALPGMQAQVDIEIEHIKTELSEDGQQVREKVILQIFVKVVEEVQFNVALDPQGPLAKVEEVIGEDTKQELVANEIELPEGVIKIADIVAEINITDTEVIRDKVIIQGNIHKQVFYIDADNVERHIAEDVPFSTFIDIPGAEPGNNVQVSAVIEVIQRNLRPVEGATILDQEIVFEVFAKVHQTEQLNVEVGPGPLVKLPFVIGEDTKQDLIASDIVLDLPAIKVKEIDVSFRNLSATVIRNKVLVQGIIHKQIYYVDEDNVERHQMEEISFSNFIDIPGAEPGFNVDFTPIIEDVIFELRPGNVLHQKVIIMNFVKVTETQQVELVPDDEGPLLKIEEVIGERTKQILVERKAPPPPPVLPVTVDTEVLRLVAAEEQSAQAILDNTFCLPFLAIKVKQIDATIENLEAEVLDGQILVSGELVKDIKFVDLNNVVRNTTETVEFEFLLDFPGITPDFNVEDLEAEIESLTFELVNQQVVNQTIVFKFTIGVGETEQVQVVTDVEGPGITIDTVTVREEVVIVPDTPIGEEPVLETFGPEPIEAAVELEPPADEIIDILAGIEDFVAEAVEDGVIFTGTIVKEVIYLSDGEEFTEIEEIPFELFFEDDEVEAGFTVPEIEPFIDDIQIALSEDGTTLEQVILLGVNFKVTEVRTLEVVTDVSGPGIGEVEREVLLLDVVGDGQGPVPVEVVTFVEIL